MQRDLPWQHPNRNVRRRDGTIRKKLGTDLNGIFSLFTKDVPLRRVASSDEIGGLCSYLASDDSSFMTGVVLPSTAAPPSSISPARDQQHHK